MRGNGHALVGDAIAVRIGAVGAKLPERWLHGAVDLEGGAQGKSKFALASEG